MFWKKKKVTQLTVFCYRACAKADAQVNGIFSNVVGAVRKRERGIENHAWLECPQNGTIVAKRGRQTRG